MYYELLVIYIVYIIRLSPYIAIPLENRCQKRHFWLGNTKPLPTPNTPHIDTSFERFRGIIPISL